MKGVSVLVNEAPQQDGSQMGLGTEVSADAKPAGTPLLGFHPPEL